MEASTADLYQKELAFLNKNFKEGSVIEEMEVKTILTLYLSH